jgi:hypothetical protein
MYLGKKSKVHKIGIGITRMVLLSEGEGKDSWGTWRI